MAGDARFGGLGGGMKLYLKDRTIREALNEYRAYLKQEEGLQAPLSDIVEGMILYFLDEHPQFRAWMFVGCAQTAWLKRDRESGDP
jgi:hypothetical protein